MKFVNRPISGKYYEISLTDERLQEIADTGSENDFIGVLFPGTYKISVVFDKYFFIVDDKRCRKISEYKFCEMNWFDRILLRAWR